MILRGGKNRHARRSSGRIVGAARGRIGGTVPGVPGAEPCSAPRRPELVAAGIDALRRGELTAEALLVAVGARRLRAAGLEIPRVPELSDVPEQLLYAVVGAAHPREAHARYNSLIRRLVSFERALEHASCREAAPGS